MKDELIKRRWQENQIKWDFEGLAKVVEEDIKKHIERAFVFGYEVGFRDADVGAFRKEYFTQNEDDDGN